MKQLIIMLIVIVSVSFFSHHAKNAIDASQEMELTQDYEQEEDIITGEVIYPLFPRSWKYAGYETDDVHYLNGQILPPDPLHSDSLKVVDAAHLNWCNEYYEYLCDGDIRDVLNVTTVKL